MIPKIIHQIWVGPDDPPIPWMQTWVDFAMNADWEYRVWTERTIPALENYKAYNYYEERKVWHGMSDVARVEILERFGGWYVDTDAELIDPIGFATDPMQEAEFVLAAHPQRGDSFPNGLIGSTPGHPILSRYVNMISQAEELEPVWASIGGLMLYRAVMVGNQPVHVMPSETFNPIHFGKRITTGDPVYILHHQYTTRQHERWKDVLYDYTVDDL